MTRESQPRGGGTGRDGGEGEGVESEQTITEYKKQLAAQGYAANTVILYGQGLALFQAYLTAAGIADLRAVTSATLAAYRAMVMSGPQAKETKALRLRPIKRLFEYLTGHHRLLINPAEGLVEICRKNRKLGPTLTPAEMQRLLAQVPPDSPIGIRDRALLETLYATGLRIGELLSLELQDLDLREGVVKVRRGKGRKERVVPLGQRAASYLHAYLVEVRPNILRPAAPELRLFLNGKGAPLSYGCVLDRLRRCAAQAGLSRTPSPHTFRRSCATHLLAAGADIGFIQELLGHSQLSTTQRYVKVVPLELKKTHQETHPHGDHPPCPALPAPPASPGSGPPHGGKRQKRPQTLR